MRGRQVLSGTVGGLEAAALLVDGRLEDVLLDAPYHPRPGAVFRAVCDRVMGGQGGAMLRLPEGRTAWLRGAGGLETGGVVLVQVAGFAADGKAVPVTTKLTFRAPLAVVTPLAPGLNISRKVTEPAARERLAALAAQEAAPEWGLILRTAAAEAPDDAVIGSIRAATEEARAAMEGAGGEGPAQLTPGDGPARQAERDWGAAPAPGDFELLGILDALDALRSPEVDLGGARMTVEPTRALVAVDVDTGGDTSPAAGLKATLAAVTDLPRQLRLRGLGGQVVMDPAPLPKGRRGEVEKALRRAFSADPVPTDIAGWTPLGHLELQRRRDRLPLVPRLPKDL